MFGEEVGPETPTIRYCAVSAIENSHKNVITCLDWIPDHMEVTCSSFTPYFLYCICRNSSLNVSVILFIHDSILLSGELH